MKIHFHLNAALPLPDRYLLAAGAKHPWFGTLHRGEGEGLRYDGIRGADSSRLVAMALVVMMSAARLRELVPMQKSLFFFGIEVLFIIDSYSAQTKDTNNGGKKMRYRGRALDDVVISETTTIALPGRKSLRSLSTSHTRSLEN